MTTAELSFPIKVFYSCAPEDDALRERLERHLTTMERGGLIDGWHQRKIGAGQDWEREVRQQLEAARVILLLISADFLASKHCWDVVMPLAAERHEAGKAVVIPIHLRACDWEESRFGHLRALPVGKPPVMSWKDQDEAWDNVARGIRGAIEKLLGRAELTATAPGPTREVQPHTRAETGTISVGSQLTEHEIRVTALRAALETARSRRKRLLEHGLDVTDANKEIIRIRRELRAGGQLHDGDALGDGRYLLVRRLGKGGFAVVWEAYDEVADARVVLKVLHPDLTRDATRVERFFRGARAMAETDHPAVVRVFERQCEEEGWCYFVMEYLAGGDFRRAVLERRPNEEDVLRIIRRVGEALSAAHAKFLIHRDVKPANIVLDEHGAPKLTDFDLVAAADTTGGTRTGALGTFLYAAPEMMDRPQEADARADVYGLGMTAVFGLYGRDLPVTMMRHADRLIEGLSCGERVKTALKKAIDWEPAERFESVAAFCRALESPPVSAMRVRRMEATIPRGVVRERLAAIGAEPLEPMLAPASECSAVAWARSGELVASGHFDGTVRLWDVISGQAIRVCRVHTGAVWSVAFSADGSTLASGADDKTVCLWDVAAARVLSVCEGHSQAVKSVVFSPDGNLLASGGDDKMVLVWDVATARMIRACRGHTSWVRSVAFGPDGNTLASGADDKTVRFWDVASGRSLGICEGYTSAVWSVAFSPERQSSRFGCRRQYYSSMGCCCCPHDLRLRRAYKLGQKCRL
ncbi:MAG: protein kinase [Minicystis sp.]